MRKVEVQTSDGVDSLNPCFNGRYSLRRNEQFHSYGVCVLILVLMEDTHWEKEDTLKVFLSVVLILVLMEDTHWVWAMKYNQRNEEAVLILVLMEDTHWGGTLTFNKS